MYPQREHDPKDVRRLAAYVGGALILHLLAMPYLAELERHAGGLTGAERPKPVRVTPYSQATLAKIRAAQARALQRQEALAKKEPPKPKPEDEPVDLKNLEGQVVDLPPSPDDRPPEHADYLSEHNTRTEHQTVSRNRQKDYQNAANELTRASEGKTSAPDVPQGAPSAMVLGPAKPVDEVEQKKAGQESAFELPNIKERDRLALKIDPTLGVLPNQSASEALRGNGQQLRLAQDGEDQAKQPSQTGSAPNQGPPNLDLVPPVGVLARLSGAPAPDYIEGVDEGDGTFLNSREFKYASFFNRLKQGVSQHWQPIEEYRRRDPTGNIYGQRSRVTVLHVTLTPKGELKGISVEQSSGLDFLDDEAVAAFRRAEPFPNPPMGLIDKATGLIDFPFGFHVEFSRNGIDLPF